MKIREIHWEVTNRCNLRCKTCLPSSGEPRPNELSFDEAMAVLAEFQSVGVRRICFTGGEPFGRPDFLRLAEEATALGMAVEVITNATLLYGPILNNVKDLGLKLGISLDGADERINDFLRGKGTFETVVKVLRECQRRRIPVKLYVTVTRNNVGQLRALAETAKEYGCEGIHFSEVTLGGRALKFKDVLSLSSAERLALPGIVSRVAKEAFGEELSPRDDRCWADGTTLYMTADGNLYLCSEIFVRRPDLTVGAINNIRSLDLSRSQNCCYGMQSSEHVVFISNVSDRCPLAAAEISRIETLEQFYRELDIIYKGIERDCSECQDPDCVGYVWLLEKEAERLYEDGVPIIQVNNGPTFIHSFPVSPQGEILVSVRYPPCSQLCKDSRRCRIHDSRPLACRLYPVGLETKPDGTIVWVLHRDCLFFRRMEEGGRLADFENRMRSLINQLSPQLSAEIIKTYQAVHDISAFPDGENNYHILT